MKKYTFLILILGATAAFTSCKQDIQNVTPPVSNEFLTTTILNLVNTKDSADHPSITYRLIPGKTLVISPDSLVLKANSKYSCQIRVLDETKTPADTVSKTIKQRANEHLFFFKPSAGLNLTDSITDRDTNNPPLPLGLESDVTTGWVSMGALEIVLRHQPNVKDGTYPPGDTDLDVFIPVKVE